MQGDPFYFCPATGESLWEPPGVAHPAVEGGGSPTSAGEGGEGAGDVAPPESAMQEVGEVPLPPGWIVMLDGEGDVRAVFLVRVR